MADHDDGVAAPRDCRAEVGRAGARREPLVRLCRQPCRPRNCFGRLSRTQERAAEDSVWTHAFGRQAIAERAGGIAPCRCQRPKVVGVTGLGLGVADEVDAHASY